MLRLSILAALAALAACTTRPDQDHAPTCSTMAACNEADGKRVHVVGVYTVYDSMSVRPKDMPPPRQVELRLGGQDGPFLGETGSDDFLRPLDEIARLRGKRVRVTGTFRTTPPPDSDNDSRGGPFIYPHIHPIERIDLE